MTLFARLRLRARRFNEETCGSIPIEGVLAFTFLVWWYIASFQFFDAYRQKNINLKAAYTVADMISRETDEIDAAYVNGLNTVFDYLTNSNVPTWIRVSSVEWDDVDEANKVIWTYSTGSHAWLTNARLAQLENQIPVMPVGDSVIIVETNMAYEPIFSVGLEARWYETFITTRPRFASQVVFAGVAGTGETEHADGTGGVDEE